MSKRSKGSNSRWVTVSPILYAIFMVTWTAALLQPGSHATAYLPSLGSLTVWES